MSGRQYFRIDPAARRPTLRLAGPWTVEYLGEIDGALAAFDPGSPEALLIDCGDIDRLDLSGAWLLVRFTRRLEAAGTGTELTGLSDEQLRFIDELAAVETQPPEAEPGAGARIAERLEDLGRSAINESLALADFMGRTFVAFASVVANPRRFRPAPLFYHLEQAGLKAVPIVSLIGFLIAIVLAYQGANQLKMFGAEIYTVDLVAISVLREMGVVLTAIMVAGRSGSAFAAEIGVMKLNEEIDAMRVLGIDPLKTLVVPRLLALVIALPLLTFIADIVSLGGGALLSSLFLDIPLPLFLSRLKDSVDLSTFLVGIVKAPVFGFIIAMVGCRRGLQVSGSADELGRLTTTAVVECIFLVILADAAFSVLFSELGI